MIIGIVASNVIRNWACAQKRTQTFLLSLAVILACTSFCFATNPVPPPVVPVCDLSDKWLDTFIEVEGIFTHFEIESNSPPATPDIKLTSEACTTAKPILVTLTYCGKCECWETRSEQIWDFIKRLRASRIKSAKVTARGKILKTNEQNFRYLFKVGCIQRIVAQ